jgi:hypothetical protein
MITQIPIGWAAYLDVAGTWVAVVLTLFVFSYLLGDNVLYRLAEHIFVGVAVGYAAVVVFHNVLAPKLLAPIGESLSTGDWERLLPLLVPLVLGLLLLTKSFRGARSVSWLGSFSLACLLGVGAALAIGGALLGTLLPQVDAASDVTRYVMRYGPTLGVFSGIVVLIGATGVLLHFYFGASREKRLGGLYNWLVRTWGGLGRWFIFIAFGALLATTFVSRLSLLIGRIEFLIDAVRGMAGS